MLNEIQLSDEHEELPPPQDLTTEELVNAIAWAGPGSPIEVIVHYPNGISKKGKAVWGTDMAGGSPSVMFYDPKKPGSIASVLPLGGRTLHYTPPRVNSFDGSLSDQLTIAINAKASDVLYGSASIIEHFNPDTQEYRFEIIR